MRKRNLFFKVLLFTLVLPCMMFFTACGDNSSASSNENGGNEDIANRPRTTALTDTELGYGGFTRDNWTSLTNNELYDLNVKGVAAYPTTDETNSKGFAMYYSGATQEKFDDLASRLFSGLSANKNDLGNAASLGELKSVIGGINYFYATREVAEEEYKIAVSFYPTDTVIEEEHFSAGDLIIASFEISDSYLGDDSGEGYSSNTAWLTSAQLEAINLTGLTIPSDLIILQKNYNDSSPLYGFDIEVSIQLREANAELFTSFATTLFNNFSANKDCDGIEISSINDAIDEYESLDVTYKEFVGYIFGTNYKTEIQLKHPLNTNAMIFTINFKDTTPEPIRTTWLTSEEKTEFHIGATEITPTGTISSVETSNIAGRNEIGFYLTGVNASTWGTYCEEKIYGTLDAKQEEIYSNELSFAELSTFVSENEEKFEGIYHVDNTSSSDYDYVYSVEVSHYSAAEDVAELAGFNTVQAAENSMIIRFICLRQEKTVLLSSALGAYNLPTNFKIVWGYSRLVRINDDLYYDDFSIKFYLDKTTDGYNLYTCEDSSWSGATAYTINAANEYLLDNVSLILYTSDDFNAITGVDASLEIDSENITATMYDETDDNPYTGVSGNKTYTHKDYSFILKQEFFYQGAVQGVIMSVSELDTSVQTFADASIIDLPSI